MRPDNSQYLMGSIATLIQCATLPVLDDFNKKDLKTLALLNVMLTQDFDRSADLCKSEVDAMSELLAQAKPLVSGELAEQIGNTTGQRADSLRLSALTSHHKSLCELLIAAQTQLETIDQAPALALNRSIWNYYQSSWRARDYQISVG